MSKFGCFETVCTKEEAEFWRPCCGDVVDKMVGKKCCFKSVDMGNGKMFAQWTFEGCPEMSSCGIFTEGVDNHCNLPQFGGECCIKFHSTDKGYKSCVDSKAFGKMEFEEVYTKDGMTACCTKDGKSFKQCWKRVVNVDGMYKCCKMTNVKEFMKKEGMPDSFCACLDDYKFCFMCCDKNFHLVECFGDMKCEMKGEFDKEFTYKMPMEGMPEQKCIVTKTGLGCYTCVVTDAKGSCTEWKYEFCDKGAKICGRSMKTGDCCEMELVKECCPVEGTWKPVSINGGVEMCAALGMPAAEAQKIGNDFGHRVCVKEKGCMVCYKYKSDLVPCDFSFKWGEEFDFFDPVLKENCKIVATKNGNCICMVQTGPSGTLHTKCTVGNCFMTTKVCMEGCPLTMTTIYMREC